MRKTLNANSRHNSSVRDAKGLTMCQTQSNTQLKPISKNRTHPTRGHHRFYIHCCLLLIPTWDLLSFPSPGPSGSTYNTVNGTAKMNIKAPMSWTMECSSCTHTGSTSCTQRTTVFFYSSTTDPICLFAIFQTLFQI